MIIGYDNKYSLSTLTATNENTAFPVENSQDIRLSRLFKTTDTDTAIVIDLGENLTATRFFLANHNLTSSAVITLEANATDVWTSPSYTNTIAYSADMIYKLFSTQTYRYWRLTISDATNTEGIIKFGGIFLGAYKSITQFSHVLTNDRIDTTVQSRSNSGQVYNDVGYIYEKFDLNFPLITDADKVILEDFIDTNRMKPVYIMLDPDSVTEFKPIYGVISGIKFSRVYDNFYTTTMTITEAK